MGFDSGFKGLSDYQYMVNYPTADFRTEVLASKLLMYVALN